MFNLDLPLAFMNLNDDWISPSKSRCVCKFGNRCAYNNGQAEREYCDDALGPRLKNMSIFCYTRLPREGESHHRIVMGPPLIKGHPAVETMNPKLKRTIESTHKSMAQFHSAFANPPKRPSKKNPVLKKRRQSPVASNLMRVMNVASNCNGKTQQRQHQRYIPSTDSEDNISSCKNRKCKKWRLFKRKDSGLHCNERAQRCRAPESRVC